MHIAAYKYFYYILFTTQVVTSKLSEMDVLIHRLLDLEADLRSSPDHAHSTSALSILLAQFTQVSDSKVPSLLVPLNKSYLNSAVM